MRNYDNYQSEGYNTENENQKKKFRLFDMNRDGKGVEMDEDRKTVNKAISELNERDRLIIKLRFGLKGGTEKTQKEVADLLGISQSYISRLEKRIITKLKNDIGNKI